MPYQGATYTFEDLSGATTPSNNNDPNPYVPLIEACDDDATKIQTRYNTHRTTRTTQQRLLLTSPSFSGVNLDAILIGLLREELKQKRRASRSVTNSEEPGLLRGLPDGVIPGGSVEKEEQAQEFVDHRHNLSFWARPPQRIRELVGECQRRLREVVPDLWLMPLPSLHMTTLELTHSQTPVTLAALAARVSPLAELITNLPHSLANTLSTPLDTTPTHPRRARLMNPALTYDAAAIALTLVPATIDSADSYTYHHLRRDLWELLSETSVLNTKGGDIREGAVPVASRYVVPSAHLTIARFVTRWDVVDGGAAGKKGADEEGEVDLEKTKRFVEAVDEVNKWLESEFWGEKGIEWVVGEEKGLELHGGSSWFGGGEAFCTGAGI